MNSQEDLLRLIKVEHGFDLSMKDEFEAISGFDSLTIIEIIMSVEREYDLDIEDELIEKLVTVQDLYDLINDLS